MKHAIPTDWDGETFCRFAICWPDSVLWRALLRGLVTEPARGFFWDEKTGSIIGVLSQFRQTLDHNLDLPEVFMACNDQNIAEALQAIATALASQSGGANATAIAQCGGGGGGGLVSQTTYCFGGGDVNVQTHITLQDGTNWPVYGSEPIAELPPAGFPDGYEDEAEYDADKCAKATKLADDWLASIRNFGNVNWSVGVIGAVAIIACLVGLITVPPAVIPLLLFALTANQGISALLIALSNELDTRRDDIICIFYEGDNAETVISLIADLLDAVILIIPVSGAVALAVKSVALWLLNADTLNNLYTAAAKQLYPSADCSGCLPCADVWTTNEEWSNWTIYADNGTGTDLTINNGILTACYGAGPSPGCIIQGPVIERVIEPGDAFSMYINCDRVIYFAMYFVILGNEVLIHSGDIGPGQNIGLGNPNLTAWEGQTVSAVRLYTARGDSNPAFCVEYKWCGLGCPGDFPTE